MKKLARYMPILSWLPAYRRAYLRGDLQAGLTVGVMLVPQGMAYGLLAGLPPVYGLYASLIPLFFYAMLGTSRQLSVGPTAVVSLLIAAGIQQLGGELPPGQMVSLAISVAFVAGAIQLLMGFLKLGVLVNFLSHPVIAGFTSAAAFIIAFSQMKNLTGLPLPRSNNIFFLAREAFGQFHAVHGLTVGISLISFMLLRGIKRASRTVPGALVVVIGGTLLSAGLDWEGQGVAVIGEVPAGLPGFLWPELGAERLSQVFPLAFTVCVISFIESVAIAKTLERKHGDYRVDPNQELIALGATKLGGAFFQAFPTTGSFSRSAVNNEAGARTGIASMISAAILALALVYLAPWFYHLPKAVLAAIILAAVINLVDWREARHLWAVDRRDWLTMLATFVATLVLGIQNGVLSGVLLSLGIMVYRNSKPHLAVLGQLPGSRRYRSISRFSQARQHDEVLIVRFDAQLYFGNASYFLESIEKLIAGEGRTLKLLLLDASSIHDVDSSGAMVLSELLQLLESRGILFYISGAIGPVRDALHRHGLSGRIGEKHQFVQVHDAVSYFLEEEAAEPLGWSPAALQTNERHKKS